MSTTNASFTFNTTGDEVVAAFPQRVAGRIFLLTGPTITGIGARTLTSLAKAKPEALVLAGRTPAKFQDVVDEIKKVAPSLKVFVVTLDLSSQASVRKAAADILNNSEIPRIDTLINNAAVMACPHGLTADGIELQFGTNHIGHFLFTNLIMPKLKAAPEPIVVNLTSSGHRFASGDFTDYNFQSAPYNQWIAYGQAKAANIFFTKALAERGLRSVAVHPGLVKTDLGRHLDEGSLQEMFSRISAVPEFEPIDYQKNLDEGSSTTLVAALDEKVPNGAYLVDCQVAEPATVVKDVQARDKLWQLSNKLVGESFA